jgi:VWFA-related protein
MSALAAVLMAGLLGSVDGSSRAPLVFGAEVEAVYLDVFVTSHGEPITGLSAADFEVRDNGVPQQVRLMNIETVGVTAVLIFDVSSSVSGEKLAQLRAAGHAFIEGLGERDQAALLTFSHEVVLHTPPTRDRGVLYAALDRLQAGGATAGRDALFLGLKLPWTGGRPLIVLFTDGGDTLSWLGSEAILTAAREWGGMVNVVASGEPEQAHSLPPPSAMSADEEGELLRLLRQVAGITGGSLWIARSSDLKAAFEDLLAAMRTRYLLSYEPRGILRAGRHRLKVSVKGRRLDVRTRSEYSFPSR